MNEDLKVVIGADASELKEEVNDAKAALQTLGDESNNAKGKISSFFKDGIKDVDGFHPINIGRMMTKQEALLPCTPFGILKMVKDTGIDIRGKHVVVIGRSNIVGKPQAMLLLHANATVTICHSKTRDLKEACLRADILVAAVGVPELITGDMIKEGAVVIDVGMDRDENGKLCGMVSLGDLAQREDCSYDAADALGDISDNISRR